MSDTLADNQVTYYDVSHIEASGDFGVYFLPPLGESVVASLVETIPEIVHVECSFGETHADYFRISAGSKVTLLDRANTELRREGRTLVSSK
ncbi:hypothetical protein KBB49_03510 [Candidatus Saccharibacteria bacterium]|nr:hypothetical protein [Candidatus Saccharibacteria bacterium]